jgi:hypothetical protein
MLNVIKAVLFDGDQTDPLGLRDDDATSAVGHARRAEGMMAEFGDL